MESVSAWVLQIGHACLWGSVGTAAVGMVCRLLPRLPAGVRVPGCGGWPAPSCCWVFVSPPRLTSQFCLRLLPLRRFLRSLPHRRPRMFPCRRSLPLSLTLPHSLSATRRHLRDPEKRLAGR